MKQCSHELVGGFKGCHNEADVALSLPMKVFDCACQHSFQVDAQCGRVSSFKPRPGLWLGGRETFLKLHPVLLLQNLVPKYEINLAENRSRITTCPLDPQQILGQCNHMQL